MINASSTEPCSRFCLIRQPDVGSGHGGTSGRTASLAEFRRGLRGVVGWTVRSSTSHPHPPDPSRRAAGTPRRNSDCRTRGSDGKTGRRSCAAQSRPMFTSCGAPRGCGLVDGHSNLLGGGRDGRTLADAEHASSKLQSKGRGCRPCWAGRSTAPCTSRMCRISVNIRSLGTMVRFEGFLGVRISLQFTWTGDHSCSPCCWCSTWRRLHWRPHAVGHTAPLNSLAFFFKDPTGSTIFRLGATVRRPCCRWRRRL